ncbi:ubiquinol-cytochrome c reductase iron-sulfur subunit [Ruicaihuangia caeni]|uniref:Cytochrome bc1 complex Rieske iron-sulfur subunit n=1 Tax=Ruicaihuangia caeni TaxID=3042517 RepID=A0AAW6T445_9MICO|nr:Rieske 2Fe-2S domain-containing protein [Klugiella sp. YN-L-19]MDI2098219.1 Rieske 2Fe-2S domain-containing protein [Klugiella sp. YN-L-19]
MAEHHDSAADGSAVELSEPRTVTSGTAVISADRFENPGLPVDHQRVTDLDPAQERKAERRIIWLFWLSLIGSVFAIAAYFIWPIEPGNMTSTRMNNLMLGIGITLGLFGIGLGAVNWAKSLMHGHEEVEPRHDTRGTEATRARAVEIFQQANAESGFTRRRLLRNSLIGALVVAPLPAVVLFRDLAPADEPHELLRHTMWEKGTRLALDPSGAPIKASDVTVGSVFHVIPESLAKLGHGDGYLEEKAKAVVLMMRLRPEELNEAEDRKDWSYDGIVAYSKICTHVGCPVALYEQQTHHLLCPCHQSEFDVANHCEVIFGPAARPLPQLPITVDAEGYLVAQSDFHEPVGPSFWERER